ncbi:MAG: putative ABC transporter permease [Clostridium sp.]
MEKKLTCLDETCENKIEEKLGYQKIFWIFVIFSIIGFILETVWCFISDGYFESRKGLVYGPFSQVYGFGAIILIALLWKMRNRSNTTIFIWSAVIGGAAEYICSFFQEKALGTVSWEYSNSFLSIGGRTNLKYCIFWGILGVLLIKVIYPKISVYIDKLLNKMGKVLTVVMAVFLAYNMFISVAALQRQSERREAIQASGYLDTYLDNNFNDDVLKEIYPNMSIK